MKLYDGKLELKALRTICEAPAKIKYMTFAQLNESHFYSEAAKESFARIAKLARKNAEIPEYESIIHDPVVSETTRAVLKKIKPVSLSDKGVSKLIGTLDKYRKARELYYLSESINNSLVEEKVDIDNLIDFATEKLSRARSASNRSQEMFHSGAGNNTSQLVKKMLNKEEPDLVPTGFNAFDQRNGGIAYGSLFTLAGKTGSGKTSLALQLSRNMADIGREDVFYVPLEMDEQECFERVLSNLSGTPLEFIKKAKLTERQKNKIWKAYKSWVKSLKRDKTRWSIFSPYDGITLDDALFTIQPFKPRVVVIDYLTLLKLPGRKDQWQELSEAAWLGKTWAKKTHGICIMLAQLGDDDKIRYSKAVAEHCFAGDTWVDTDKGSIKLEGLVTEKFQKFDNTLVFSDGQKVPLEAGYKKSIQPLYKVVCEKGYSVEVTSDHPIKVLDTTDFKIKYVETKDLDVSIHKTILNLGGIFPKKQQSLEIDISNHPNTRKCRVPKKLTPELAYLVGAMLADGYIGKHGATQIVTHKDQPEFLTTFSGNLESVFGLNKEDYRIIEVSGKNALRLLINRTNVDRTFTYLGLLGGSKTRYISDLIMQSPKNVVVSCLRGLFDGDGTVSGRAVVFNTVCVENAKRVQYLLRKLGIMSTTNIDRLSTRNSNRHPMCRVVVTGSFVAKFKEIIGFSIRSKQKALEDLNNQDFIFPHLSRYLVNTYGKESYPMFKKLGFPYPCKMNGHELYIRNFRGSAIPKISKDIKKLDIDAFETIQFLQKTNSVALDIYSVEFSRNGIVYDLTTGSSNFSANGLSCHNSNNSWTFGATKESRENKIMEISQIKARNQYLFDFTLGYTDDTYRVFDIDQNFTDASESKSKEKSSYMDNADD